MRLDDGMVMVPTPTCPVKPCGSIALLYDIHINTLATLPCSHALGPCVDACSYPFPPMQVPRLTAVLRALTDPHGAAFDPEAQYIARSLLLEARRKEAAEAERAAGCVGSPGGPRSRLAQELLGPWERGASVNGTPMTSVIQCSGAVGERCVLVCVHAIAEPLPSSALECPRVPSSACCSGLFS
jgi:hypothetical protein